MRELTLEELELVAGGNESDIVVVGNPGDSGDWGGDFGDSGGSDGGSSDSSPSPPPAPPHTYDHADCAAKAISDNISSHADSHYMEYRGFIYRDPDGSIHASDVSSSGQQGVVSNQPGDVGVPANATIIGTVHDHPDQVLQDPNTGATEPVGNPQLASMPSYLDMKGMYDYVQAGGASASDYSIYIDFNGAVTEYKYSDQNWSNLADGNHGQATWAAKSADYDPCQ